MSNRRLSNFINEDISPCVQESQLTNKCLADTGYDSQKCSIYFMNYNNCKKFWGDIFKLRKNNGIKPYLPTKAEREKIMEERKKGNNVFAVS